MKHFVDAISSVPQPPCTAYACASKDACAQQKLACESFIYYVNTGRTVHPLMLFRKVGDKKGWKVLNMLKHAHAPTRELFNRFNGRP